MTRSLPVLALLALAALAGRPGVAVADRPADPNRVIHYSEPSMGTVVHVTIWGDDEEAAARAARAVFDEFGRIDRLMSTWIDDTAVTRVNAAAGRGAVKIDPEVLEVLSVAQDVARRSGGAFDVTVGAFQGLWRFDEDRDGSIPDADEIAVRARLVDHRALVLDRKARTARLRRAGMRITLGGIAKGYAVDRAVKILHEADLVDFIVQAGGDLFVSGRRGDRKWRVGIRDPRGSRDATFAIAEIENRTFSTSGDYERSVIRDGVRYHHILDPKSGNPARASRSVTVMAKDALTADAWSTALFVLGPEKGLAIVEKSRDLEAVFVGPDNRVHVSSGLEGVVVLLRPPTAGP